MDNRTPKRTRDEIMQSMAQNSSEIRSAFGELKESAMEQMNIRRRIVENPWPWLIGGLLFGCWLGSRTGHQTHR